MRNGFALEPSIETQIPTASLESIPRAEEVRLGTLAASIAHEINQPLNGIITNLNTCKRMLAPASPNVEGALETTRRAIRDANRVCEVIQRLQALFNGKELAAEPVDLNEATREVIAQSLNVLRANEIFVQAELADDLPILAGDRVQLQQVIMNLIRNAAEAMSVISDRPRQLLIRTEMVAANQIQLSVKDSGVGFAPQDADRMFSAFHTTKPDGMGIGLSVSRSIIEAHRGRLSATLNHGPGSTFSFVIPCGTEDSADAEAPANCHTARHSRSAEKDFLDHSSPAPRQRQSSPPQPLRALFSAGSHTVHC
jgi:signal transduction histidine kinase